MRAITYIGNESLEVIEKQVTAPGPGEVQIKVAYAGICGTDLHILHGNMDSRVTTPLTFGHEMSGEVNAVGEDIDSRLLGKHVTVMPLLWDGTCPVCVEGHHHICANLNFVGIDSPGAMQEFWNVPATIVFEIPESVSLQHAALVEPVAVAVHDVRRAQVSPGQKCVVIGGGPIGFLIASVISSVGADALVLEPDQARRAQLEELGIRTHDPLLGNTIEVVSEWTSGKLADVVFEVSGAAAPVEEMTNYAKPRGTIVVVAIHPNPRPVNLQQMFWKELHILGARVYETDDFETAIDLITSGKIPSDKVISHVFPLEQSQAALEVLRSGGAMKVLIEVGAN